MKLIIRLILITLFLLFFSCEEKENIIDGGNYYLSYKDYTLDSLSGNIMDSEITIEEYQLEKHLHIYGYNLENICEDYKSIPPSVQSVGKLALENYDKWMETDLNQVSPNYITNFNLGKVKTV